VHPTKVIGICLNTYDLDEPVARAACERAERETGLPCTDPVRFDSAPLIEAIASMRKEKGGRRKEKANLRVEIKR